MATTVRGISWNSDGGGVFYSPRFKSNHELFVAGQRGDWTWQIHHRAPPTFSPHTVVAEGKTANKLAAMVAAHDALRNLVAA